MEYKHIKNFTEWNVYKEALNSGPLNSFFHEREIWWCALGINIGSEQDGKNEQFERPVLIVKKINVHLVLVLPITSKVIPNHPERITTHIAGKESQIMLSQMRIVSSKRLLRKIERIKIVRFQEVLIRMIQFILPAPQTSPQGETPP